MKIHLNYNNKNEKIAILELQNKDMKTRLEAYERIQSNWETFKSEFNHESDSIGESMEG